MTSVMTDYIHVSDGGEVSFIPGEMTDNRTTELLRELLDERGVEWSETVNSIGCVFTWYESAYFGEVGAMDNCDGYLYFNELNGVCLTPEQAIAATLGSEREKALEELVRDMYEQWAYSIDGYYRGLLVNYRKRMAKLGVVNEC